MFTAGEYYDMPPEKVGKDYDSMSFAYGHLTIKMLAPTGGNFITVVASALEFKAAGQGPP